MPFYIYLCLCLFAIQIILLIWVWAWVIIGCEKSVGKKVQVKTLNQVFSKCNQPSASESAEDLFTMQDFGFSSLILGGIILSIPGRAVHMELGHYNVFDQQ